MNESSARTLRTKTKGARMSTTRSAPKPKAESLGLAAIGSAGGWEVAIDETTSGTQKWFAQIEGPSIYLYFAVESPRVIDKMLNFLSTQATANGVAWASPRNGQLVLGKSRKEVTLLRDDEFADRYFLLVENESGLIIRLTISGADVNSLVIALKQAKEDLEQAED